MSLDDMLKVKYQGIRPAPGYPSQPDHREKKTLFDMLQVEELLGGRIGLTDSSRRAAGGRRSERSCVR